MNWKEHARLFCNGKFRFLAKDGYELPNNSFTNYQFADWDEGDTHKPCFYVEHDTDYQYIDIDSCTLIARKIDSLSNDDITRICEDLGYDHILTSERRIIEEYLCSETDGFLHLLSIGVYPFDQSHFEDGTVIDIKTLTAPNKI